MKRLYIFLTISILTIEISQAQVKIGDNPTVINSNSMLELESTNKGFLAPRVILTNLLLPAPLTAPVPAGMMVYNSAGGSIAEGYYTWNGARWLRLLTSANTRDNFVLVKSAADFPAPVGGIITLLPSTVYEINGTITLTSRINLNGSWIRGVDAVNDKLIYTPATGELITGSLGGNIRGVTLSAPTVGSRVFNIDAAGANSNLIIENCYILNSNNIGLLRGFGGTVYLQTIAFFFNTNGITFENDTNVVLNTMLWDRSNSNIYERYVGNFSVIQKANGATLVTTANTATGFDVSGVTGLRAGELKNVLFTGNGTYKTGTFSKSWEVESTGLTTEKDDVASGNIYISSTAATVISTINTPYKVAGTTASSNLFRVTAPANNRLTYTGTKTRRFQVICSLTSTFASILTNRFFTFYIAKNGVVLPESRQRVKLINNTDQGSTTLSCTVSLAPNDYVELWVENNSDATDITIQTLNLAIR